MAGLARELSFDNVAKAADTLKSNIYRTPVYQCPRLSQLVNASLSERLQDHLPQLDLYFKCENLQNANSKFRGASYFVSQLSEEVLRRGVVAYSTGNHALALASACKAVSAERGFAIPVVIIMPQRAPPVKIDLTRGYGAKVICYGTSMIECLELAQSIRRRAGMTLVPPTGHPDIVLGQGTVALEFLEQVQEELTHRGEDSDSSSDGFDSDDAGSDEGQPPLDILVVPSAGSGLLAGAAIACQNTGVNVIAAEPEDGVVKLLAGCRAGDRETSISSLTTIADDLHTIVAEHDWDVVCDSRHVRGIFSASEDDIQAALDLFVDESKMRIESSGAVALAALLFNEQLHHKIADIASYHGTGRLRVGVVISGGNTAVERLIEKSDLRYHTHRALNKTQRPARSHMFQRVPL